jgi:DNA-binding response OmpR family regulator
MNEKILVIDDDIDLIKMLKLKLELQGYAVFTATNGLDGMRQAYQFHPDCIILDIMMPEINGFEVCERLRGLTDVPILFLSAKTSETDMLRGYRAGADDYITKPFSFSILFERISAILKRAKAKQAEALVYEDDELCVDLGREQVYYKGQLISLTPTEFRLLSSLIRQKDSVVPQNDLVREVWGPNYSDAVANLSVYIHYLREKLAEKKREHKYIRNRWGVGYWFASKNLESNEAR